MESPLPWLAPVDEPTRTTQSVLHAVQLLAQCAVVVLVLSLITYMTFHAESDFELWNWLWEYASPALVFLLSLSFTALLIHEVDCMSTPGHLWFQGGSMLLATFCAVVLVASCAGVTTPGEGEVSVGAFLGITVLMWLVFFIGFLQAAFMWFNDYREQRRKAKGKRRERGYGTTSGGLAVQDDTYVSFMIDV